MRKAGLPHESSLQESVGKSAVRHEMFIDRSILLFSAFAALRLYSDRLLKRGGENQANCPVTVPAVFGEAVKKGSEDLLS